MKFNVYLYIYIILMLNSKDFDPIQYLNERFPDEASLAGLD